MTDIAHHLKPILKLVKSHLAAGNATPSTLHAALRQLLPTSYGLGAGQIYRDEQHSAVIPLLIYDEPLANGNYTPASRDFQLKHVLLTLEVLVAPMLDDLRQVLDRTASVKALCPLPEVSTKVKLRPLGQQGETVPKYRLPLSVIVLDHVQNTSPEPAEFCTALLRELDAYPLDQQPDYLIVEQPAARLYNPWLMGMKPPARICDPIVMALQGEAWKTGQLLKDYRPSGW